MNELLHAEGFLGTGANWAADMTLIVSILVGVLFTAGAVAARQDRITLHKWLQTTGATLNLILVVWLMILPYRDFVARDLADPTRPLYFHIMTTLHAIVGAPALIFGWYVVLRGHGLMIERLKFQNYKPYMRWAYGLYMSASALGVLVYVTWFLIVPNPPVFK